MPSRTAQLIPFQAYAEFPQASASAFAQLASLSQFLIGTHVNYYIIVSRDKIKAGRLPALAGNPLYFKPYPEVGQVLCQSSVLATRSKWRSADRERVCENSESLQRLMDQNVLTFSGSE